MRPITIDDLPRLKGAPLSALVYLLMIQRPATRNEIATHTRYSRPTIGEAYDVLAGFGLVTRGVKKKWQLTAGGLQLPLMWASLSEGSPQESQNFLLKGANNNNSLNNKREKETIIINERDARDPESQKFLPIIDELKRWDIYEPKASALARLDHLTIDYIRKHCAGVAEEDIPLAIYRMEHEQPPPKKIHEARKLCADCYKPLVSVHERIRSRHFDCNNPEE